MPAILVAKQKIKMSKKIKKSSGFTIVEIMVSVAIFSILALGMLSSLGAVTRAVKLSREKIILSSLASNYLEVVRNMSYGQIGTISGNPIGTLPDINNQASQTISGTVYKIYYEVTYLDDPADGTIILGTDAYAADYKQVKMNIKNNTTGLVTKFVTNVVPQGLEGTNNQGALKIQVIDSQGNPVPAANVVIKYPTTTPTQILNRSTDAQGLVLEVGLNPAVNNYRIEVSKPGYSGDQTYQVTATNPNPYHPDPTIVDGGVTSVTFSIDLLATLNIMTLNEFCSPISGVNLNIRGAKLIGAPAGTSTPAGLYKFNNSYGSVSGAINLTNLEWDTYTPTLLTGQSYVVFGTSPIQKIDVLPGTAQTYTMILGTNSTVSSILVIVKDAATGVALEGANVHLRKNGSPGLDLYDITGGSVWVQSDWSGGSGITNWNSTSTSAQYYNDDGNIDTITAPTGLRLKKIAGSYLASGWAESSTFDTGTNATNYTILSWQPSSQSTSTALQFQVAANNDNLTWNYVGPNGTAGTYFTTPGQDISAVLGSKRYVRYKAYLSTADSTKTPVLTSVNLNFVTGCFTPGQSYFGDLVSGSDYDLDVTATGYQSQTINNLNISGNQSIIIEMGP